MLFFYILSIYYLHSVTLGLKNKNLGSTLKQDHLIEKLYSNNTIISKSCPKD